MQHKKPFAIVPIIFCLFIISCGSKKETPASIAQKWCELNAKAYKAEGASKEAAEKALEEYENSMEKKYEKDEAFLSKVKAEVEKCEEASEGRR